MAACFIMTQILVNGLLTMGFITPKLAHFSFLWHQSQNIVVFCNTEHVSITKLLCVVPVVKLSDVTGADSLKIMSFFVFCFLSLFFSFFFFSMCRRTGCLDSTNKFVLVIIITCVGWSHWLNDRMDNVSEHNRGVYGYHFKKILCVCERETVHHQNTCDNVHKWRQQANLLNFAHAQNIRFFQQ